MTDDIITKLNVSEAMPGRSALLEGGNDRKPNLQKLSARGG